MPSPTLKVIGSTTGLPQEVPVMSYDIRAEALPERLTLVKRAHVAPDELGGWLHRAYQELFAYIAERDVPVTGPPFGRYASNDGIIVEAGIPIAAPIPVSGDLVLSSLPATDAATTCHVGPYERLLDASDALEKWIHDHGYERKGPYWEVYVSDPESSHDPETLQTVVIMPYRLPMY
jgi:effector-binding domain-containing protein